MSFSHKKNNLLFLIIKLPFKKLDLVSGCSAKLYNSPNTLQTLLEAYGVS